MVLNILCHPGQSTAQPMSPSHDSLSIACYHMRIKWNHHAQAPPARLLRYAFYLCAGLLVCVTLLLWQAPNLIQRHLPGWLATHYGLHLTLGEINVGLRSPPHPGPPPCSMSNKDPGVVRRAEGHSRPERELAAEGTGTGGGHP